MGQKVYCLTVEDSSGETTCDVLLFRTFEEALTEAQFLIEQWRISLRDNICVLEENPEHALYTAYIAGAEANLQILEREYED